MVEHRTNKRPRRAKLIFNPIAGAAGDRRSSWWM